ncbi:NAD-dependent epimerase/dehydratase family protein [Flavobacterium sp. Sd200]|uniref:UDP-N-acetylglucosamine 4,6-dehydratase family protein n=1 Tax=Flavobacterium sp. Sd200 TaxID=2692211 RepID=UPI0013680C95|nr:polysaccharide biosynthesis protein [Flavobacterium sp. Sd200]MXN91985.1 NAD-dependent epimerase/dehydratase family protein [Flavobacterium sp. Sd200]
MIKIDYDLENLLERKPILLDSQLISGLISGKTILITGAAGSIGSEIVKQVAGFNPGNIILLDQAETPLFLLDLEMQAFKSHINIHIEIADVSNKASINQVFKKHRPDVVFHAAAYKHVELMENNPSQAVLVNVMGTKNVADMALRYQVGTFVLISTDKAVKPGNVMGASKRVAEKYIQALHTYITEGVKDSNTKFLITRFGNVLGSNGSVVPVFAKQIMPGGNITVTHPEIKRYFMTVKEACQLVLDAGAMGRGGEIYTFDMGKQVKILDLAIKMIRMAGLEPETDVKITYVGLRPGEKLYEELLTDTSKMLPTHNKNILISRDACEDYDYVAKSIKDMVRHSKKYNSIQVVREIKKLVPEFISANSEFEKLD